MAMATKSFSVGLRGVKQGVLFSKSSHSTTALKISVATITSRSSRTEPVQKPKPWPYRERGYRNWHSLLLDSTWKRLNENTKVIVVEGMPAIGKSNLARAIAEELEMKYFPMVTSDSFWVNQYGHDSRQIDPRIPARLRSFSEHNFLEDPSSPKTINLQYTIWHQKLKQYMDALAHVLNTGEGVVLDRCVYSEPVFTNAFIDMGFIKKEGKKALNDLRTYSQPMEDLMRPHLIIYLDAPISVVETNLKKRGRGEERVFNRELLEKIEHNYKFNYLKEISKHAELLAYDWSVPGDGEVIVEDIERIDFDRFDIHDSKMEDWRMMEDQDWDEKRWLFTERQVETFNGVYCTPVYDLPYFYIKGPDHDPYMREWEKVPGNKYTDNFNADAGDTGILWKLRCDQIDTWRDFDLQPLEPLKK